MNGLNDAEIEIINPQTTRGDIRFAVFDFDGTLSLIREGWQDIMIPMMVHILVATGTKESEESLTEVVKEFVSRLTGKQTIYQMMRLADEVAKRGGHPKEPLAYKHEYHGRLWERIESRVKGLKDGSIDPKTYMVPYADHMLKALQARNVTLFLASGTDLSYVQDEVAALGLSHYFDGGIYGALDKHEDFSKQMLLNEIMTTRGLSGSELLVVGDGYVEIEEGRRVGGITIGVASDEARRSGIDAWKRTRLIEAGADIIIPEFQAWHQLTEYIFEV